MNIEGGGGALASLSLTGDNDYDLLVYRVPEGGSQATLVHTEDDWLEYDPGFLGILLPSWEGAELALPEFEGGYTYYVVLANGGGLVDLAALANVTVETTSDVVSDPGGTSGTVSGDVMDGDTAPAGTAISAVNGTAVTADGTEIEGTYGTLTINLDGSYSYEVNSDFDGSDGAQDVFEYTVRAPDGSTESASLTITLDLPEPAARMLAAADEDVVPLGDFAGEGGVDGQSDDQDFQLGDEDAGITFANLFTDEGDGDLPIGGDADDRAPAEAPATLDDPLGYLPTGLVEDEQQPSVI